MIGVLLLLLVICLVAVAAHFDSASGVGVQEQQRRAEQAIDAEARAAKRAMNDASGASWRNLVD